jgi:hypothetical protein
VRDGTQLTSEVSKLLEQALFLSIEEQETLANSMISKLDGVGDEGPAEASGRDVGSRAPHKARKTYLYKRSFDEALVSRSMTPCHTK